jgi:hypothetical protein
VVKRFFARVAPWILNSRMMRAVCSRPMSMPARFDAFHSLSLP